jgi:hypothetical protein
MRIRSLAGCLPLAFALAGCGGPAPTHGRGDGAQAMEEAVLRQGDIVVRASAIPAEALGEAVARQYGLARDPGSVMLLVGVRRGDERAETVLPARVEATATDLLGKRQAIAMREVRSGEFVDYVGSARVIAPDTLRFDVEVAPEGGPAMSLRFNRDFFPR